MRNLEKSFLKNIYQVAIFLTLLLISENSYGELKAPQFDTGIRLVYSVSNRTFFKLLI